jgi:hypothetical protein
MSPLRIFIGYDPREAAAYRVCIASLREHTSVPLDIAPVNCRLLSPLYNRPHSRRAGVLWDDISDAPMSTEFSLARFMVPHVARRGPALFVDCDFLFRADVSVLFELFDPRYAVQVVKHEVTHREGEKMDGQKQTSYARKNWSSLMLMNCDYHLAPDYVNAARGLTLHQLDWAEPYGIGELPREWNYLANVSPPLDNPAAVHFTLGTPDMPGYENAYGRFGDEWREYASRPVGQAGNDRATP